MFTFGKNVIFDNSSATALEGNGISSSVVRRGSCFPLCCSSVSWKHQIRTAACPSRFGIGTEPPGTTSWAPCRSACRSWSKPPTVDGQWSIVCISDHILYLYIYIFYNTDNTVYYLLKIYSMSKNITSTFMYKFYIWKEAKIKLVNLKRSRMWCIIWVTQTLCLKIICLYRPPCRYVSELKHTTTRQEFGVYSFIVYSEMKD